MRLERRVSVLRSSVHTRALIAHICARHRVTVADIAVIVLRFKGTTPVLRYGSARLGRDLLVRGALLHARESDRCNRARAMLPVGFGE
jgi:hypothetical protein